MMWVLKTFVVDSVLSPVQFSFGIWILRNSLPEQCAAVRQYDTPAHRNLIPFSTTTKTIKMAIELIAFGEKKTLSKVKVQKNCIFNVLNWELKSEIKNENFIWICQTCAHIRFGIFRYFFFSFHRFCLLLPFDCICIPFHSNFVWNCETITEGSTNMCMYWIHAELDICSLASCTVYCYGCWLESQNKKQFEAPEICTYR